MLKVLSASYLQGRLQNLSAKLPANFSYGEPRAPLLRVLGSLRSSNSRNPNICKRVFFCSESGDGSNPVVEAEAEAEAKPAEAEAAVESAEEVDSKASSAIVPTNPRPEDYLTVLALPLPHRPLFPGFYMPIYVKDPKLLAALVENRKRQAPYAGAFLLKDEPGTDPSLASGSETEKNVYDLKGKDLFNRLHEVGTLAQITSIQGDQVVLIGHRRLRITEMVDEDPLTVKVDHLKDKPYNKDDDFIKATSFEVIATLRDVLKTSSLWRDHVQTYTQHIGDFNFPRLADFGAAISGANKLQCQQVLEELDGETSGDKKHEEENDCGPEGSVTNENQFIGPGNGNSDKDYDYDGKDEVDNDDIGDNSGTYEKESKNHGCRNGVKQYSQK